VSEYTFNELHTHLRQICHATPSGFIKREDLATVGTVLALIESLTDEERRDPKTLLNSRSRWRRAVKGSGAAHISRHFLKSWLGRMSAIITEIR
jgi:signal recognition particle GTPase